MPERIENLCSTEKFQASICRVDSEGFDARVYTEHFEADSENNLATLVRNRVNMLVEHYQRMHKINSEYPLLTENNFKVLKPGEKIPIRQIAPKYPTVEQMKLVKPESDRSSYLEQTVIQQPMIQEPEKELVGAR